MVTDLLGCVMSSEAMAPTCLDLLPKFGRPGRDEDGCVHVLVFVAMRIGSRRRVREGVGPMSEFAAQGRTLEAICRDSNSVCAHHSSSSFRGQVLGCTEMRLREVASSFGGHHWDRIPGRLCGKIGWPISGIKG
ncbi:hypothetical protein M758_2G153800 [Ceratodon purpureus]|nr:hypothetical protein M758_2G153800 [Ceratodon purpureus]